VANKESDAREPLSEQTFLILLSLAEEPLHGYAIVGRVADLSDGRVRLGTGTLYGAVKRLLGAGWIRRVGGGTKRDGIVEPPRTRKAYELTQLGRSVLGSETNRLRALVRAASQLRVTRDANLSFRRLPA
jgi:DNA-binding PadR family transcriptional regulator